MSFGSVKISSSLQDTEIFAANTTITFCKGYFVSISRPQHSQSTKK